VELLKDREAGARRKAAEILSAVGPAAAPAVPALAAALKDADALVQRWAVFALGEIGPGAASAAVDLMAFQFATPDMRSRAVARASLQRIAPDIARAQALSWDDHVSGEIARFYGHRYWVQCVTFSPDGRLALSGSGQPPGIHPAEADFSIRVWDLQTRREQRCLVGHSGWVTGVVCLPGGTRCLSGSYDATVHLWDLAHGKLEEQLRGHLDRVRCVAVSPDGRLAVSGACDGALLLWNIEERRLLKRLVEQKSWIVSVAFAPDGRSVLFGSLDGSLRLWHVDGKKSGILQRLLAPGELRRFLGHEQSVTSIAFDTTGRHAVSGSMDKTVRLWDVASGAARQVLKGHLAGVTSVALALDGRHILSGSMDKTIRWWDAATGTEVQRFEGHTDVVTSVALSSDGRLALSGSADRTVRLWRLPGNERGPETA
jgi:WD40 repeat protein